MPTTIGSAIFGIRKVEGSVVKNARVGVMNWES
jgi:hypothetical protein